MAKPTRATRGPKPKFLDVACPNSRCQHRGKTGLGNVVSNGTYRTRRTGRARLFLCRACGKAFSSRTGTAFFGLRTRKRTVLLGLRLLAEGLGLRGTARVLEVKLDTVRGWLALAAQLCDHVSHLLLRELRLSQVQVDELWTFVKKTPRSPWADNPQAPLRRTRERGPSLGTTWIWRATLLRRGIEVDHQGMMVLSKTGRVRLLTPRAQQWLEDYFGGPSADRLPTRLEE